MVNKYAVYSGDSILKYGLCLFCLNIGCGVWLTRSSYVKSSN